MNTSCRFHSIFRRRRGDFHLQPTSHFTWFVSRKSLTVTMTCILLTPQVSSIFVCQLRSPQPSSCFGRRKKFPSQCNYFHCPRTLCVVISNVTDDAIGFNRFISCSHAPDCPHFTPLHQCHEFSKIKCNMYHHLINSFFLASRNSPSAHKRPNRNTKNCLRKVPMVRWKCICCLRWCRVLLLLPLCNVTPPALMSSGRHESSSKAIKTKVTRNS